MDDAQFDRWFAEWKGTRPDTSPIGWYDIHELQAAFAAGRSAQFDQAIRDIIARSQQLQAQLLSDERPGSSPPAGPLP